MDTSSITEQKFNRISIAIADFEKAEKYLEEATRTNQTCLAYEALIFSAIICYAKPFSNNEQDAKPKADKNLKLNDFDNLTEADRSMHIKLIELRNKALAHSEYSYYPTKIDPNSGIIRSIFFEVKDRFHEIEQLRNLVKKLAAECHNARANFSLKISI